MDIDLLITNAQVVTCKGLAPKIGKQLLDIGVIEEGAIACRDGKIVWVGKTDETPPEMRQARSLINAAGKVVMPGFVDPHTHLVFGGSREDEYALKLQGVSYLEILKQGGGILSTVEKTRYIVQEDLYMLARSRVDEMLASGTTTIEVKSGYGLDILNENKILRVAGMLQGYKGVDVVPTFLGAHAWPKNITHEEYMEALQIEISLVHQHKLAEFCDVFCEEGAFSLEEARRILECAKACSMKLKIHAGEMSDLRGGELAAELGVTSLDHGEHISDDQIEMLARRRIPIVLMPGVNFHLMTQPAPARKFIEMGVPVALATDFNPGSSPVLSMQFIIQLACRMYRMSYEEAINAATINAACAIDRADIVGSIEAGKQADLLILDIPTYKQLPYWIGRNCVETVIKRGKIVYQKSYDKP